MEAKDLIGKTISSVSRMKKPEYSDTGYLQLSFTDGTKCTIWAGYSAWDGKAEDAYPTFIGIGYADDGLVPVKDE